MLFQAVAILQQSNLHNILEVKEPVVVTEQSTHRHAALWLRKLFYKSKWINAIIDVKQLGIGTKKRICTYIATPKDECSFCSDTFVLD